MFISVGPHIGVAHSQGINLTGWPFRKKDGSRLASFGKWAIEKASMNSLLDKALNETLFVTQTSFLKRRLFGSSNEPTRDQIYAD
jgi:tRNA C32,U32 (ribose-2'-O)-methylase TrmJ